MRAVWIFFIAGCGFESQVNAIDAAPAEHDADTPDPSIQCPASYDIAFSGPSRYRLIKAGHPVWEQSDTCNQDMAGATHLVTIETDTEFANIKSFANNLGMGTANDSFWTGGVQLNTAAALSSDWLGFDGMHLFNGWDGSEPNDGNKDGNNNENDHEEQFIRIAKTALYFIDTAGNLNYGALCECDGKPIAATVTAAIDGYR